VIEQPTGLHLIHAISGIILGDQASQRPGLIVADAVARGCMGASIARGLRDLDLRIPVVLIADPRNPAIPVTTDTAMIVDPANAASAVAQLVAPLQPALFDVSNHELRTMA
jgi:FixJ family two-component response regulator